MNNLRYAFRQLVKNPGFTTVAVLTLALGLSANTTIFSIISALFFQPLPVKDPERLVLVLQKSATWKMPHGHSWPDYNDYRDRVGAFEDVIATFMTPVHLSVPRQEPERAWIEAVSGNYFSMLGIEPAQGRFLQAGEGKNPGADPVIVLSHAYWLRKFGGNLSAIGQTVQVNGHPFTIVGVTPPQFASAQWSIGVNAFIPATMLGQLRAGGEDFLRSRGAPAFKVFARLKPGVTLAQSRAAVAVVAQQLAQEYPKEHKEATVFVMPERYCRPEPTFSEFMPIVSSVFMVMVGLVLLIACANVANLMFSRALARQKEMSIRTAIGASRGQLIWQLLTESVLLAVVAGVVGLVLAYWSGRLLAGFSPAGDVPIRNDQHWDWRVSAFSFLVSVLAGVITGLAPALRATKLDVQATLKEGSTSIVSSARHRFRSALVVSQVAICLVVLVAGGLFVRSLQQVAGMDLGFRTDHLLMASLDLDLQGYGDARSKQFCRQLLDRVKTLPGVRSASLAQTVPLDYGFEIASIAPAEKAADDADSFSAVHGNRIDPDYLRNSAFATMPLRMGATLAGVQGLLGLLLAVMGLYGVVSYAVSQRTREIGIRMALGARRLDIFRLVVRDGLKLTALGLALGLLVALAVAGIFGKILYGLTPAATPVVAFVVFLLAAVSMLACWLPARRAARVDPMVALRCE